MDLKHNNFEQLLSLVNFFGKLPNSQPLPSPKGESKAERQTGELLSEEV